MPQPAMGIGSGANVTGEPTITGDGLTVYWMFQTSGTTNEVYWAQRPNTSSSFLRKNALTNFPVLPDDMDPSVSGDGSILVYLKKTAGQLYAFQVDIAAGAASSPIAVFPGESLGSIDLSADGMTLYYTEPGRVLARATRTDLHANFTVAEGLGGDFHQVTVSADGLELMDTPSPDTFDVRRATRGSVQGGFSSAATVYSGVKDPDISADDRTLVVANENGGISIATRTCP